MRIRHIPGRSKPWCLDLGEIAGKRQRLFFKKKGDAEKQMQLRERVTERHGEDALAMATPLRLEYMAAEEALKKMNPPATITQAVLFYKAHAGEFSPMPLADAIAQCVAAKEASGKRKIYIKALKQSLKTLLQFCNSGMASNVTQSQIEEWARSAKRKKSVSLATVRGRLINASTLFKFCLKRNWVLKNPCNGIETVETEEKPPGIHTVEEVKKLLTCALEHDPALIGYLAPIYFGGLRPSESAKLAKAEVHSDHIEVQGPKGKGRRRRFVPINETLKAWLAVPGVEFGISSRTRRVERLRWILGGMKRKKVKQGKKRSLPVTGGFSWSHDVLRHSFCSYALPIYGATKTAEWAGHSEQILFAHYRERVKPTDAQSYWNLLPAK